MKNRALVAMRFALAALVIAFVATRVPWFDRVSDQGGEAWVQGELVGHWRDDAVGFKADDQATVPDLWQGEWAVALREHGEADLVRGEGADWEPGLWSVLADLQAWSLLGVFLAVLGGLAFGVTRWWRLLRVCGVPTRYAVVARLTLLGMFFNLVIPGLTGGDIVKAGMAAKEHPGGKGAAITAVAIDRMIGLWTLLVIAAGCSLALRDQLSVLVAPLLGVTIFGTGAIVVLCVPRLRVAFGATRISSLLPSRLSGLVDAIKGISENPRELFVAVALSACNHLCIGAAIYSVTLGIGDGTSFIGCLSATVVASAVSAVPLAPGGWGVGEAAYAGMFSLLGAGETVGYAVSVSYRLCQTGLSLICGAALWRGNSGAWKDEALVSSGQ